jgi:hypothetical protein
MAKLTIIERAKLYLDAMPPGISGQGRHNATVAAANILLHGWALKEQDAWALLMDYNARCVPPSDERKLRYRFDIAARYSNDKPDGWLCGDRSHYGESVRPSAEFHTKRPEPPQYDPAALKRFSGHFAKEVDLLWLGNRSAVDPSKVDSAAFLRALFKPEEKILLFNVTNGEGGQYTQGEAVWPDDEPLKTGRLGVWMLPQPVDGTYRPNTRSKKEGAVSRRHAESCLRFPFLVLESDTAPLREWLGCLVQLPLRIAAIYTSGGRSVHALVKVNAATKGQWDDVKSALAPTLGFLIKNGLDKGVLSAVRLTRLPGAFREGKLKDDGNGGTLYQRFESPAAQKLLYLNPEPDAREICDLFPVRDLEETWLKAAANGVSDADETGGQWLRDGLGYYANVSPKIKAALAEVEQSIKGM